MILALATSDSNREFPCDSPHAATEPAVSDFIKADTMTQEDAIKTAKQFRKDADELLQRMKQHKQALTEERTNSLVDDGEVLAQHIISMRALEDCIMRQGMVLKNIGNPTPYPESYNPESSTVHPTSGVKL